MTINWPHYCNISNSCFLRMVAFCSHRLKMRLNFQIVWAVKGWMHSGFRSTTFLILNQQPNWSIMKVTKFLKTQIVKALLWLRFVGLLTITKSQFLVKFLVKWLVIVTIIMPKMVKKFWLVDLYFQLWP